MADFDWKRKLTQKDLDNMVLESLGEGDLGSKGAPDIVKRLKEAAAKKPAAEVTSA